jgi:hypothetical protein
MRWRLDTETDEPELAAGIMELPYQGRTSGGTASA